MSVTGSLQDNDSLTVSSYSELLYFKRNDTWSITPTRRYTLRIYRHHHLLYRSEPIIWSQNGLDQAIERVDLVFPTHPSGLIFVISVESLVQGRGVRTEVNITGAIRINSGKVRKDKSGKIRIKTVATPRTFGVTSLAVNQQIAKYRRKTMPRSSKQKGISIVKAINPYPVTQNKAYTVHTYTTINPVGTFVNTNYQSYFLTRTSVRTVGFKAKSKKGLLPLNPFSMLMQKADGGSLSIHKVLPKPPVNSGNFSHTDTNAMAYASMADIPTNHLSMDENRLVNKLASRINAADSNIPEDLIQAHQTIQLFTSNVNRLRAFGKLKNGGSLSDVLKALGAPGSKQAYKEYNALIRNGVYSSRILSQMWLELRYGWLPLIQDIHGSIATFSQYVTRNRGLASVSARNRKINDTTVPITGVTGDGSQNGSKYTHTVTDIRMKIWYNVDSKVVNAFAQLGFTSPTALAWELIPFSFVVDWFLPIGNALQLFHTFDGLAFHKGFKTYFTKQYCSVSLQGGTEPPYETVSIDGMAFLEGVRVNRTILTDFPTPNFPRMKNPVSTLHAANAVALLVQAFTSK